MRYTLSVFFAYDRKLNISAVPEELQSFYSKILSILYITIKLVEVHSDELCELYPVLTSGID
uniref:Uncharacterized protein n=1 Tax=Tolypothrix bouteillei VB521301 TaxID=1479485 RepID=A0A0C1R3K8_9CYAN